MESRTVFLILFPALIAVVTGKYVHVLQNKTWGEALELCRRHHTDLALINGPDDQDRILRAAASTASRSWIGLYLVNRSAEEWMWSGAGSVTYTNWLTNQPNYIKDKQWKGEMLPNGQWNDYFENTEKPFYCSDLIVKTNLSWERALENCKSQRKNLTGLTWDNERLQTVSQMQREGLGLVWVGLRFLGGQWLRMNGAPLEALARLGVSECPVEDRCGALNSRGWLRSVDCKRELYFSCV